MPPSTGRYLVPPIAVKPPLWKSVDSLDTLPPSCALMWGFGASRRLQALEEDFQKLHRDFLSLELEWSNVYDKLRKVLGRVVKSRAIIEQAEGQEAVEQPPIPTMGTGVHGLLTPHQRQIQQNILKRRAGG